MTDLQSSVGRLGRAGSRWIMVAACLTLLLSACSTPIDLRVHLKVVEVSTGWFDAGIVPDGNKLVPTVTFRLQNQSSEPLGRVQINAVFRRVNETEEFGSVFTQAIGSEGLTAGQTSKPLALRAERGYTGKDPRAQMLHNKEFVDVKVDIFAKHGPSQWVLLGDFPIERHLLTK